MQQNLPPVIIISLLDELILRDGLLSALSRRDDTSLEPILRFLAKHVLNPRYSGLLIDVVHVVLGGLFVVVNGYLLGW